EEVSGGVAYADSRLRDLDARDAAEKAADDRLSAEQRLGRRKPRRHVLGELEEEQHLAAERGSEHRADGDPEAVAPRGEGACLTAIRPPKEREADPVREKLERGVNERTEADHGARGDRENAAFIKIAIAAEGY